MSPSTFRVNSLPNLAALTFCGVRTVSFRFAPVRALSYWEVVTCPWSERIKKPHRQECLCHGVLMIFRKLCLGLPVEGQRWFQEREINPQSGALFLPALEPKGETLVVMQGGAKIEDQQWFHIFFRAALLKFIEHSTCVV